VLKIKAHNKNIELILLAGLAKQLMLTLIMKKKGGQVTLVNYVPDGPDGPHSSK